MYPILSELKPNPNRRQFNKWNNTGNLDAPYRATAGHCFEILDQESKNR
jgi:hypothetical protein